MAFVFACEVWRAEAKKVKVLRQKVVGEHVVSRIKEAALRMKSFRSHIMCHREYLFSYLTFIVVAF